MFNEKKNSGFGLILILSMILLVWFSGCKYSELAGSNTEDDLCQNDESLLKELIPDLKTSDVLFQLANHQAMKKNLYTKAQVESVFDEVEKYLLANNKITGQDMYTYAVEKIRWLRENAGEEIIILSQLAPKFNVPRPITACDRALLLKHIQHQREQVLIFFK